jgi:hypothetical protein
MEERKIFTRIEKRDAEQISSVPKKSRASFSKAKASISNSKEGKSEGIQHAAQRYFRMPSRQKVIIPTLKLDKCLISAKEQSVDSKV